MGRAQARTALQRPGTVDLPPCPRSAAAAPRPAVLPVDRPLQGLRRDQPVAGAQTQGFELTLSDRAREIAILLHAFHRDSPFELYAHRKAGRAAGLTDAEVEGLATRTPPAFRSDEERHVFATTLALVDRRTLDDAEYTAAVAALGERTLFELVTLLGYYDFVATQLAVFGVEPPEG